MDDHYPPDWTEGPDLDPDEDLTDDLDDEPTEDVGLEAAGQAPLSVAARQAVLEDNAVTLDTPYTTEDPPMTMDGTALPEPVPDDTTPVLPAQVVAFIRTASPFLVTWILAGVTGLSGLVSRWLGFQLGIPEGVEAWLATGVPVVLGAAYYALARVLERRWPRVPWLGSTKQPLYTQRATKATAPTIMALVATGYVWYKGGKFSPAFRDMLVELDRRTPDVPIVITQGGFNVLAVSASAGTHAGDAVDISVRGLTQAQVTKLIAVARELGLAASFRTTNVAKWGTRAQGFSSYHVHGIPNGWGAPSAAAKRQVAYTDANGVKRGYRNGRDGLKSNGADLGPGHTGSFRLRTWAGYLASRPKPGLPESGAPGPIPRVAHRKPWPWITEDGKLGPVTIRRLQQELAVALTGELDHFTVRALKAWLGAGDDGSGILSPDDVRRLQYRVGTERDGVWRPTATAYSPTTAALQRWLNRHRS